MTFSIEFADEQQEYQARIKVIGCGGSGGNAVNTMINFGLEGVEFIVVNTDAQALNNNAAPTRLNIGNAVTRGLGAGADPERGRKAAMEDHQRIKELITGADMVFITAGMGGGTGTGAAPVIAQLAREEGALTVGVVTKPFLFEGRQRSRRAELGLAQLSETVDTLITIPNQKLLLLGEDDLSFVDAFRKADEVLYQAVKGISDLITQNGIVNVDFADVKTVMNSMGRALMGTGIAKGQNRARLAAEMAVSSPLLDDISVDGATGVLINIVGGPDLKMREIQEAASLVQEQAHEDANIIFGASIDEQLGENVKVTVIATGFDVAERMATLDHAARVQVQVPAQMAGPSTVPSMQMPHHHQQQQQSTPPQSRGYSNHNAHALFMSRQAAAAAHPQGAGSMGGPQHHAHHDAPAFSNRRVPSQAPQSQSQLPQQPPAVIPQQAHQHQHHHETAPAPSPHSRAPAGRVSTTRERTANFPAFDTDWDVPAFQRKGGQ